MKLNYKIVFNVMLLCVMFCQNTAIHANSLLPDYYPKTMPEKAVVQSIDLRKNIIQMNGVYYPFATNVEVMLLTTQYGTLHYIKKDMVIGFLLEERRGKAVIVNIWELPDSMAPPPH